MKRPAILLTIALFAASAHAQIYPRRTIIPRPTPTPDIPIPTPDPAFPLRLHIHITHWGGVELQTHGYGTANLLDPAHPQGFDYAFTCQYPFIKNDLSTDAYQARWRRAPYEIDILTGDLGGSHARTCTLRLTPEAEPFNDANAARLVHTVSSNPRIPWMDPAFAYEIPAPDYPVQFHVLDGHRLEARDGDHGYGTANLSDPASGITLTGADYRYDCYHGFMPNSQLMTYYQGHWVVPNQKLELLLARPGSDKVDKCTVTLELKPQPYPAPITRASLTP
jgi:hypothetical protein